MNLFLWFNLRCIHFLDTKLLYLLVYVDDIILTGNNADLISQFVACLAKRFSLKDLGNLSYFLGVEVIPQR